MQPCTGLSVVSPIIFKCVLLSLCGLEWCFSLTLWALGFSECRLVYGLGSLVRGTEVRSNVTILMTSESLKNSLFCFVLKNNLTKKKLFFYHTE